MINLRSRSGSRRPAFTLVEVLVATVLTVAMLTLVMASFWTLWQTYRTSDLVREMQHEATFAMTRLADKIRSQEIDYAAYTNPSLCQPDINRRLCLSGGSFFRYEDENLFMGDALEQDPLFSQAKFALTELRFEKFPTEAPVRTNTDNQFQPQVSIYFQITSRQDIWGRPVSPSEALSLDLQTTISSRDYNF